MLGRAVGSQYLHHFLPLIMVDLELENHPIDQLQSAYQSLSLICMNIDKCRICFWIVATSWGSEVTLLLYFCGGFKIWDSQTPGPPFMTKKEVRRELTAWQAVKLLGRWSWRWQNVEATPKLTLQGRTNCTWKNQAPWRCYVWQHVTTLLCNYTLIYTAWCWLAMACSFIS